MTIMPVAETTDRQAAALAPTLRVQTRVLPGGRIDFVSPHLVEGQAVEVDVRLPAEPSAAPTKPQSARAEAEKFDLMAWLDSLPADRRTPEEWAGWEREFQQERDSWDR